MSRNSNRGTRGFIELRHLHKTQPKKNIVKKTLLAVAVAVGSASAYALSPDETKCVTQAGDLVGPPRIEFLRKCLHKSPPDTRMTARMRQIEAEQERQERRSVRLGMTPDEATSRWGRPERINRTTTVGGTHEQWVYPGYHNYLYFTNDVLTSIQN